MRLVRMVFLAMATFAMASPVPTEATPVAVERGLVARDLNNITTTMDMINAKVDQLQEDLFYARPGHFITALNILKKTKRVHKALRKGTKIVEQQPVLNMEDSTAVAKKVLEEVKPRTTRLVNSLINKKYAFKKVFFLFGDFTGKVKKNILKSKELSVEFGNTVVSKLDPSYAEAGANVTIFIAEEFDRALAVYEKKKKNKKDQ